MTPPKPFAFVLMPFASEFDDIYKLGIQAVAAELGVVAERVDEQIYTESMLERIYRQIEAADFVIADMSGRTPNVFYEVGYAHAKGKLCTLLTKRAEDIPFDLKHHRHLVYGDSIQELRRLLIPEIGWLKSEVERRKAANIKVEFKRPIGTLIREGDWLDKGSLDVLLDIHNPTQRRTAEIEAVYIYTTPNWKFYVGGHECPARQVDIDGQKKQHFLPCPVTRLSPNAWTQIRLTGERILWSKFGPHIQEKQNEYKVSGHILIDVVTSEGKVTDKLNLDVSFNDFPF